MDDRSRSDERGRSKSQCQNRSSRSSHRHKEKGIRLEDKQQNDDPEFHDESSESPPPRPRTEIQVPNNVPPEFAWLSGLITTSSTAIQNDVEQQFMRTNRKVKQVKSQVKDLGARVTSNEAAIKSVKTSHDLFVTDYYKAKVANDLELKLLREELGAIKHGRQHSGGLASSASTASGAVAGSAAHHPHTHNPYSGRNLENYFICGNLGGIEAELVIPWLTEESAKAGVTVDDIQCARPICSWAFIRFHGMLGKSPRDCGYVWRDYLEAHPMQPLDPTTGRPFPEGTAKPLWSNLHREKEERDRRAEVNSPKAYLHSWRKLHNHEETYKIRESTLRFISGAFTPGAEDVRVKNQKVATFRTEASGARVVVWENETVVNAVMGPLSTNTAHPFVYADFVAGYPAFLQTKATTKS